MKFREIFVARSITIHEVDSGSTSCNIVATLQRIFKINSRTV